MQWASAHGFEWCPCNLDVSAVLTEVHVPASDENLQMFAHVKAGVLALLHGEKCSTGMASDLGQLVELPPRVDVRAIPDGEWSSWDTNKLLKFVDEYPDSACDDAAVDICLPASPTADLFRDWGELAGLVYQGTCVQHLGSKATFQKVESELPFSRAIVFRPLE